MRYMDYTVPHDVPKTKGAVLIGGLASTMLTGFLYVQVAVYFKVYQSDARQIKIAVALVWLLDTAHTVFIWLALWSYFISNFGREQGVEALNWEIGIVILFTGLVTYCVHIFHTHRLYRLAKRRYLVTLPILAIASTRLVLGVVSSAQMLHYETIARFRMDVGWIFTSGLVMSAAVDVFVTIGLISVLCSRRRGTPTLNAIVGLLMKYAFETACITCAGSLSCVFCWTLMRSNLVFLGLYFVVAKFYANSLLSTLNVRRYIRKTSLKAFPDTPVERMQFRPRHQVDESITLSEEEAQVRDMHSVQHHQHFDDEIERIGRESSSEGYHVNDMSFSSSGRRCPLSKLKPPCLRPPDCIHPKGRTVVEVKVEKNVHTDRRRSNAERTRSSYSHPD